MADEEVTVTTEESTESTDQAYSATNGGIHPSTFQQVRLNMLRTGAGDGTFLPSGCDCDSEEINRRLDELEEAIKNGTGGGGDCSCDQEGTNDRLVILEKELETLKETIENFTGGDCSCDSEEVNKRLDDLEDAIENLKDGTDGEDGKDGQGIVQGETEPENLSVGTYWMEPIEGVSLPIYLPSDLLSKVV